MRVTINFQPFLVKLDYEAHYYGSVEKAALLKIDEAVFNGNGRSFEDWQEIKNFGSYHAFKEADRYAESQFRWLRFYTVISAYSALHRNGRFVRLVYQGKKEFVDAGNQINIIIFLDPRGCHYIYRNDFLATHLNSYGRNNWVSLFVATPDATKAEHYQNIVKFYKEIYPKFWSSNQLVDIKFKDNLHVIKFYNPTYYCYAVLDVSGDKIIVRNRFYWSLLSDNSPLFGRLENYVRGKYDVKNIMFVQQLISNNGTHFEVSYLDKKDQYQVAYVLYIKDTDVFTDDKTFFAVSEEHDETAFIDVLPKDLKGSIVTFLRSEEKGLTAVLSYAALSPRSYAAIVLVGHRRWQVTLNWRNAVWVVASRQPYADGYYVAHGYPSVLAASSTGFLARLYHSHFSNGYTYVTIENRAVGAVLYHRFVYSLAGTPFEAVVESTYGVSHSHILVSWNPVLWLVSAADYGYGVVYTTDYGVDRSLLYVGPSVTPAPASLRV